MPRMRENPKAEQSPEPHDERAQLKQRIELSELRAIEVEMQARLLEAKVRLGEAQARLKLQRQQAEPSA